MKTICSGIIGHSDRLKILVNSSKINIDESDILVHSNDLFNVTTAQMVL